MTRLFQELTSHLWSFNAKKWNNVQRRSLHHFHKDSLNYFEKNIEYRITKGRPEAEIQAFQVRHGVPTIVHYPTKGNRPTVVPACFIASDNARRRNETVRQDGTEETEKDGI